MFKKVVDYVLKGMIMIIIFMAVVTIRMMIAIRNVIKESFKDAIQFVDEIWETEENEDQAQQ